MQTYLDAAGGELHANRGLGLQAELVPREAAQQVGLAHTRVPNQHHLEQIVIAAAQVGRAGGWA